MVIHMTLFILTLKQPLIGFHIKDWLKKSESYDITSKLHKWIFCFVSNRLQWVKLETYCSYKSNVTSGIPQGSILGPILFAIYINDLPNCLTNQCDMIADDVKIYNKSFNHDIVEIDKNNIIKWSTG